MFYKNLLQYKNILPVSFSLIISIMIFTSLFAVSQMQSNSEKMIDAMSQQNLSHKLLKTMTDGADRRSSIVFEMLHTDDPFVNDDLFLELNSIATTFTVARNEFEKQVHNHLCKPILAEQGDLSKINAPLQLEVYELLQNEEKGKAIALYENTTLPKQKEINKLLDNISKMEFDLFQSTAKDLKDQNEFVLHTILVFDLLGILLSILLTFNVTRKQRLNDSRLAYLANTDVLTNLPNRANFIDKINRQIKEYPDSNFAVIFFDIDYFKSINDNYGHQIGDAILKRFSNKIKSHISGIDVLSRFGGDEFILLLRSKTTEKEIVNFVKNLSQELETSFIIDDYEIFISSSIGASLYPEDTQTSTELLKYADIAMYTAKQTGRNCCRFFSKEASKTLDREHLISHALHTTLKENHVNNDLHLVYQPLLNINNNDITECEALIRWESKNGEEISPDEFIPLAEKSNLIEKINLFVIDEACRQQSEWQKQGLNNIRININLSGNKLIFGKLLKRFKVNLTSFNLKPSHFGIELTERTLNEISQDTIDKLEHVRKLGMKISIDDFGTDYSSLMYLKKLPVTTLKIDKEFICGLPKNKNDQALVKTIISLGHSLKLDVVAEGVETIEQKEFLKRNSCDIAQGYLFHRPLTSTQLSKLLRFNQAA